MKKIMVTIAAVTLGYFANAAAVEWSAYPIYDMGTEVGNASYLVYFFDTSDFSVASANAELAAGNTSFVSYGIESYGGADGFFMGAGKDTYGNSETVTGYLVVFNASSIADATHAFVSETASGTTGGAGQAASIEFVNGETAGMSSAANWQSLAAVPEPTSGLLLLLGMAGLALRRKQA
jgi:hypothetical protein